jgi:phosphotransferase system enzyme I (PtsP)
LTAEGVTPASAGPLAQVLDYLAFVAKSRPLSVLLDEAPRRIATCVEADVVSLYLLEGDGRSLVMRGNVGFPRAAPGNVRLTLGEGITGYAVEMQQPIFTLRASEHEHFRDFPELDEARFPAFAVVPILGPSTPLGAVVVQRRAERPFTALEVSLVAALTAPISAALRMAALLDDLRDRPPRETGVGTRKVTLAGIPVARGRSLGAIAALRRPSTSPSQRPGGDDDAELLATAFDSAERAIKLMRERGHAFGRGEQMGFLDGFELMLDDRRLRLRALELLDDGQSIAAALGRVAREATRAASERGDPFSMRRAHDLEQLCDALLMMASPDSRATLPSKAVLVAAQLGVYDLLISARTQPVGVVLTDTQLDERTRDVLELLQVPAIRDVQGALRWAAPGDIALVDADHGLVTINPSRADIAAFRTERRRLSTTPPPQGPVAQGPVGRKT